MHFWRFFPETRDFLHLHFVAQTVRVKVSIAKFQHHGKLSQSGAFDVFATLGALYWFF